MKFIRKQLIIKNNGYSFIEIVVVLGVVALMTGLVIIAVLKIAERERARECSGKLLMVYSAVNYYCLDNNLPYGSVVNEADLISSGLLKTTDELSCPATDESFQSVYTNGVIISCPSGLKGHVCKP